VAAIANGGIAATPNSARDAAARSCAARHPSSQESEALFSTMYWSRTGSFVELLLWFILCGMWWAGGWLLVTYVFRLRGRERLFGGMALGWLLFIVLSNLFTKIWTLSPAFWAAAA
jgi:hypothetical protein